MEMPTLRQLEFAVALADHGHFGHAAEAVHVSQPGLSGQIRELERRLGVALFERAPRQVMLTSAGVEVIARGRQILRQVEELGLAAATHLGTVRGHVRVAAIPTTAPYLLPTLVQRMRTSWPDAHFELQELLTTPMVTAIEQGDVDLGLLAVPFETGSLHVEPLVHESFHLALPVGHELADNEPLPLAALTDLEMLLLPEGHCLRDHARQACELAGRVDSSEIRAASLTTLTQMVASGFGVTLLPASAIPIEARPAAGITTRPLEPPAPGRSVALAWRATDPRSPSYEQLLDPLRERLAEVTASG